MELLSYQQVVLLCDSTEMLLLICGNVYSRPMRDGFKFLPTRQGGGYCPIWALINMDFEDEDPPLTATSNIWPILAPSPSPTRWKRWAKYNDRALWGRLYGIWGS